jgi:L-fuculose-phosphate aldolase
MIATKIATNQGGRDMDTTDIKNQICDVCGKMWQLGWVAANDGNVSVRLADGTFLATPTGISKAFITPEKLVRIDAAGGVIEAADGYKPSSEIKMHLRCYEERGDVGAVVHAHPPTATGFAVANRALDGYTMVEAVLAIGSVPVTPYGTPSTYEVPDAIAPYLQEHDVLLLRNHGALAVGCDLLTAYYRMETLELWAHISLNAHLLGGAVELPREDIDKLIAMRGQFGITGRHPGYKKYP